jgi:NADH-quinone oxidoreductase subunit G
LGNLFGLGGFEYESSDEILRELRQLTGDIPPPGVPVWKRPIASFKTDGLVRVGDVPIYAGDALVRRAAALQQTDHARPAALYLGSEVATALRLSEGDQALVQQNGDEFVLSVVIDAGVPSGCAWIPAASAGSVGLGPMIGELRVVRAEVAAS